MGEIFSWALIVAVFSLAINLPLMLILYDYKPKRREIKPPAKVEELPYA